MPFVVQWNLSFRVRVPGFSCRNHFLQNREFKSKAWSSAVINFQWTAKTQSKWRFNFYLNQLRLLERQKQHRKTLENHILPRCQGKTFSRTMKSFSHGNYYVKMFFLLAVTKTELSLRTFYVNHRKKAAAGVLFYFILSRLFPQYIKV